jgi:hypothetical protein
VGKNKLFANGFFSSSTERRGKKGPPGEYKNTKRGCLMGHPLWQLDGSGQQGIIFLLPWPCIFPCQ